MDYGRNAKSDNVLRRIYSSENEDIASDVNTVNAW